MIEKILCGIIIAPFAIIMLSLLIILFGISVKMLLLSIHICTGIYLFPKFQELMKRFID